MKRNLGAVAIGVLSLLGTIPVQAMTQAEVNRQMRQIEAQQVSIWFAELEYSFCNQDWTNALSASSALMGSEAISSEERWWLYTLRQDMYNYSHGIAEFQGCDVVGMVAGVSAEQTTPMLADASPNWQRLIPFRGNRSTRSLAITPSTLDNIIASAQTVDQEITSNSNRLCSPIFPGLAEDLRVASGSLSTQWNYEILQPNPDQFYGLYWRQDAPCEEATRTDTHPTQEEVHAELQSLR